ncbi:hypothetical protein [Cupriavidus campinensis]
MAVVEDAGTPAERARPAYEQEGRLAAYVRDHAEVREKLRGFICRAPSEWDASGNEARYRRLNDPDGFFGKRKEIDPNGYGNFIKFLNQLQFLEKTPLGGGQKFWFFHPLAFIRHFRRCGWLNVEELASTFPRHMFYERRGSSWTAITSAGKIHTLERREARERISLHAAALNRCMRKYFGGDKGRIAIFLAQVLLETAQWRNPGGPRRLMHEWGFGRYSSANPATKYYGPFYGRGIMQLTWAGNYKKYDEFRRMSPHDGPYVERLPDTKIRITEVSVHYTCIPMTMGRRWSGARGLILI